MGCKLDFVLVACGCTLGVLFVTMVYKIYIELGYSFPWATWVYYRYLMHYETLDTYVDLRERERERASI